eukprot:TRINITY_DN11330_c0_g2_i2.p4 TRINITY_DN11330_c0_g2~~TRINITY_DN11330_c0_g2_i2.p4  ORF type:complete len:105 (+),score=15.76 TRINITY_DN11330_c0_g2_i2:243-557(+)
MDGQRSKWGIFASRESEGGHEQQCNELGGAQNFGRGGGVSLSESAQDFGGMAESGAENDLGGKAGARAALETGVLARGLGSVGGASPQSKEQDLNMLERTWLRS